jgi:hypothetical protein
MPAPFTKPERESLLQKVREALLLYNQAMDRGNASPPYSSEEAKAFEEAQACHEALSKLVDDYFGRLPLVTMSCCPFDRIPLIRTFDPFGLDGLWWRSDASPKEMPTCPHFCFVAGAVDFGGRKPLGGDFEGLLGPQAPFVIPSMLEKGGMVAVLSQLTMENGYVAYPVAYFAERRPSPQELTAGWARTNYVYTTQLGISGWRIPNLTWDFELLPWLKAGKLRWCDPGSGNSVLSEASPVDCPYLDLTGKRVRMIVQNDRVLQAGLPTGEPLAPFF